MTDLRIEFQWHVEGRLSVASGASLVGVADNCLKKDPQGRVRLPGDGAKGAIRGATENWVRAIVAKMDPEKEDRSSPPPGVLQRVFAPRGGEWRFFDPVWIGGAGGAAVHSSTRIADANRVAESGTRRSRESWDGGAAFRLAIEGWGLDLTEESEDWWDALFCLVAAGLTEQVGGGDGTGYGRITLRGLHLCPARKDLIEAVFDEVRLGKLLERLREGQ
jgi:CRISPR/Cas system CSM-associated protein Csm3 (group 7 of RAMP superfamily)